MNGRASTKAWLPESFVTDGGRLEFGLASMPAPQWASAAADAPPSFAPPAQ